MLGNPDVTAASVEPSAAAQPRHVPRTDFQHLYHHLNKLSRSRAPSPLKDIFRYMGLDGMLSLAGGLPHPDMFPFLSMNVSAYDSDTRLATTSDIASIRTTNVTVPKNADGLHSTNLAATLQYGDARGLAALTSTIKRFVDRLCKPAYSDYEIVLSHGSTDAWNKVVSLFVEFGDTILVEGQTYPSSQTVWIPMGCVSAPVTLDKDGIVPEALDELLENWGTSHPGQKKPRLLYCIPAGQNPTGSTLTAERKAKIYEICVRHDIIICEDDPYYFLQFPTYDPQAQNGPPADADAPVDITAFLDSLEPSFLKYDYDGRVVRLATFSKTLAPGFRVGWVVANSLFSERLIRANEALTQTPSGWSQAIVTELLATWGDDGFLTWVKHLRDTYTARRNWMCGFLDRYFDVDWNSMSAHGVPVYLKQTTGRYQGPVIFKFVPPKAGMFVWLTVPLDGNAHFQRILALSNGKSDAQSPEAKWTTEVWEKLAEARVLLTPGTYYTPWQGHEKAGQSDTPGLAFFRMSFSLMTRDNMDEAIQRVERVFREEWTT
ncbi:pyridoxal phosphate-dependent transferase [Schizophyllum commune]